MTTHPRTDDPLGYRHDLADALAETTPAAVAFALAQCVRAGVTVPDDQRRTAETLLPAAVPELNDEIGRWAESARTLGERWTATDDPWEADELVRTLVELRADAEGLVAVVGDAVRPAVDAFDVALLAEEGLLATVAATTWMADLRRSLSALDPDAKWLNPVAEPPDLPPPDYYAVVRDVRAWKAAEPVGVGILAADRKKPVKQHRFVWQSPDGRTTATLGALARMPDAEKRTVPIPLIFESGPGTPALELVGTSIRLGTVRGTIDANAEVSATAAAWWAESDGQLFVGPVEIEWKRVVTPEVPDVNL